MSNEMTWQEAQEVIKEKAKLKSRGWQSEFARKLGVKRQYISDIVKGKKVIPEKYLDEFLKEFGLQIVEDK
jgi:plasmid maintenance system antidote protein VapI